MDPYKVLGVSPNASDDEVKQAYRALARKYHPDKYVNNPLADLAAEKMKEINEAYDTIVKQRENGGSSYQSSSQSYSYGGGSQNTYQNASAYGSGDTNGMYMRARQFIAMGNVQQAEVILNSISDRNAEWYYLRGSIDYRRGWYDQAQRNFQRACEMNPHNMEYRQALNNMMNRGAAYRGAGTSYMGNGCTAADCCTAYCLMDLCCNCF